MGTIFQILVNVLGDLWYSLDRRHREIALRNLAFAYGDSLSATERQRLAREVFRHFVRFAFESVELLVAPFAHIKKKVVIVGEEFFQEALTQGRGAIIITAHAGNWEYGMFGFGLHCGAAAAVGREPDQPWLRPLLHRLRTRGGNWWIGKRQALKEILTHLRQNRMVGIVMDQNTASEEGLLVDFFGKPARTTPVAAILARRRGVPVLPGFMRRLPDGRHLVLFLPPIPLRKTGDVEADILHHLTQQSLALEAWVRRHPEQWLWFHRRWKNQFPELYEGF
jgi:KDO2-lipid IV(A) lauroyltransferase